MRRPVTPLAFWESRVWIGGAVVSITAAAVGFRAGTGAVAPWLAATIIAFLGLLTTALLAWRVRGEHEYQRQLQEEATRLRGRIAKLVAAFPDLLPKAGGTESVASSLSPAFLNQAGQTCDFIGRELARLEHDRAEMRAVMANLDGGVIALGQDGKITSINDAAVRFFHISGPCIGLPLVQSIRQPELVEASRRVLRDRSPREVQIEVIGEDGLRRMLRVLCTSLRHGDVTGVLIAARDESESRRSEEVRREFVANVSHELKTPLAAIKGYAETVELAIADDPEAAVHFVTQIRDQCKRLERLIADMMTLARAQAGTQHLRPTTVDLDGVIGESIATYAPVAAARQIELTHRRPLDRHTLIHADREATLTIANNVIGNAIRYTPEGGHVCASSRREGSFGVLTVEDDGIGIPENEQKRIFERFYRVDKSRKHSSNGTGLGLSIVKNLTQAQNGEIKLRSRQGEGSTFEIYLPVSSAVDSQGGDQPTEDRLMAAERTT